MLIIIIHHYKHVFNSCQIHLILQNVQKLEIKTNNKSISDHYTKRPKHGLRYEELKRRPTRSTLDGPSVLLSYCNVILMYTSLVTK